ncbi:MAG: hypothetical protein IJI38_11885, partial [Clostridia bacterium]|nr:hypothetical protein [Clostridia bacterium]
MESTRSNFIWDAIDEDLKEGHYSEVHTRFPPEPNGYMHIGHCKALIMDFLTAEKYGGKCNLRFDDTNPAKEDTEYVEAIKRDIHWLGFDWTGGLYFASDYYDKCYEIAEDWIQRGLAYVDVAVHICDSMFSAYHPLKAAVLPLLPAEALTAVECL